MKILPKAQRESHRYVAFTIQDASSNATDHARVATVTEHSFAACFQTALIQLVGTVGLAYCRARVIQFANPNGVIQTNPKGVAIVRATLATLTQIGEHKVITKSTATSGVLHSVAVRAK